MKFISLVGYISLAWLVSAVFSLAFSEIIFVLNPSGYISLANEFTAFFLAPLIALAIFPIVGIYFYGHIKDFCIREFKQLNNKEKVKVELRYLKVYTIIILITSIATGSFHFLNISMASEEYIVETSVIKKRWYYNNNNKDSYKVHWIGLEWPEAYPKHLWQSQLEVQVSEEDFSKIKRGDNYIFKFYKGGLGLPFKMVPK